MTVVLDQGRDQNACQSFSGRTGEQGRERPAVAGAFETYSSDYFLASIRRSKPSDGSRRTKGRGQRRLAIVSPRPACCWPTSPRSRSPKLTALRILQALKGAVRARASETL